MDDYRNCRGCFSNTHNYCSYEKYNADSECPCTKCVVKVMCNKPCDRFRAFRLRNYELRRGDK